MQGIDEAFQRSNRANFSKLPVNINWQDY